MENGRVEELTYSFLPGISPGALNFDLIEKGGSGRIFFRVTDQHSGQSWVAMAYSDDRPDNARFASITDFLINHGVAVPAIVGRLEAAGYLLVEDLGTTDLGDFAGQDWETVQKPGYEKALGTVFVLHQISEDSHPEDLPELEFCFDAKLYQWEQDYFFKHYVARFESPEALAMRHHEAFSKIRDQLSDLPRVLVHRDFQSTNVMFKNQRCYLIDYQGMRFGLPEYDVASMIYDPYVNLIEPQRKELIEYYYRLKVAAGHRESYSEYETRLDTCAMQRLMQALGAYGFLGKVKDKPEFLNHIAPARARLKSIAARQCEVLHEML